MPQQAPPSDAASVVLTFLESVGRRADVEFYLRLFRELPRESFAIIAAEAPVVRYALGSLVEQLGFLRDLGLLAPVIVGLFDPPAAEDNARNLCRRLQKAGLSPILHGAEEPDLASATRTELRSARLPVLSFARLGHESLTERFARVGRLVAELGSRKLVVLRRQGGLCCKPREPLLLDRGQVIPTHEGRISVLNLETDLEPLLRSKALRRRGDVELLEEIERLLLALPGAGAVASVTSPLNLLRELFTVRGAGTYIKRGTAIRRHRSYEELDILRLGQLLESTFERRLQTGFFDRAPLAIYVEESYKGAAILMHSKIAPFLTKFAVERVAQGEGIGRDLWQAIVKDHPSLFWRARAENPITGWYLSLCDGMVRVPEWTIYFRGVPAERIPALVEEARRRPEDFEPTAGD